MTRSKPPARPPPPPRWRPGPAGSGRSRVPQHVAHTADGLEAARLAARLELAPEVADIDGQGVRARIEVEAPDPVEQDVPGQHLPGVAQEQLEQVELDPGQGEGPLAPVGLPGGEIHRELPEAQDAALAFEAAPQ